MSEPRWMQKADIGRRYNSRQCPYCMCSDRSPSCGVVKCELCAQPQCHSRGLTRGQCALCYRGLLPGWSRNGGPCSYKGCGGKGVARGRGNKYVCVDHARHQGLGTPRTDGWVLVTDPPSDTRSLQSNPGKRAARARVPTVSGIGDTELDVWEERDRLSIRLLKKSADNIAGDEIAEWWDDDARQMVEDGFFDRRRLHASVYEYAKDMGLLVEGRRNPGDGNTACSWCKRLVDAQGKAYGSKTQAAGATNHTICAACRKSLEPEIERVSPLRGNPQIEDFSTPAMKKLEEEHRRRAATPGSMCYGQSLRLCGACDVAEKWRNLGWKVFEKMEGGYPRPNPSPDESCAWHPDRPGTFLALLPGGSAAPCCAECASRLSRGEKPTVTRANPHLMLVTGNPPPANSRLSKCEDAWARFHQRDAFEGERVQLPINGVPPVMFGLGRLYAIDFGDGDCGIRGSGTVYLACNPEDESLWIVSREAIDFTKVADAKVHAVTYDPPGASAKGDFHYRHKFGSPRPKLCPVGNGTSRGCRAALLDGGRYTVREWIEH